MLICNVLEGVGVKNRYLIFFFPGVWYAICQWIGISTTFQKESLSHMEQFEGLLAGRRTVAKRVSVIWFACIWSIWKATNGKLFQNKEVCVYQMTEK